MINLLLFCDQIRNQDVCSHLSWTFLFAIGHEQSIWSSSLATGGNFGVLNITCKVSVILCWCARAVALGGQTYILSQ